tara:strand:+ start:1072 stop:1815 length:744 start_codon:yes stop_codon:yes gene_type:complete
MVDFLKRFRKIFFKYWIRPWAPFMLMVSPFVLADDNEISLEQSGNNFSLDIEQVGYNNKIGMLDSASYINNAPNLDIQIVQYNFTSNQNQIIFDEVSGSNNTFKLGQGVAWQSDGSYTYDGAEGGGHYIEIDLYGDNNSLKWHQTNQSGATDGHDFNFHLAGDWNEINGRQQSSGAKEMNLTIYNDDNIVTLRQKGANTIHTANITLDGIYGTDLTLKQLGTTAQTYSLSQNCYTVGGCTISVQQGN